MRISPTPVTAAAAGFLSATLWPLAWSRFGNGDSSFSIELMVATLLLVALPAHAFVVGFNYRHASDGRALDVPLLKRVGAWLVAAVASSGFMRLFEAVMR